ncbi:MAG: PorT family protein [Bacteroidia bacterium]|nr:PorT family protein [Bacteroidia bacterium]
MLNFIGQSADTLRKIFILIPIVFCSWAVAQSNGLFFIPGIAAGVNGCQIHGDDQSGYRKAGLYAGADVRFSVKDKNMFQIGLFYSEKGSQKNQNPEKNDFTFYHIHLRYVEMPVTYYRILSEKKYFLSFGIYSAYLINYFEYNEYGNWTGAYPFKKMEFGINAGLGKFLTDKIVLECRFGNSFLPIREYGIRSTGIYYPNPVARIFNRGLYNNIVTIELYYRFIPKEKKE